MKTWYRIAVIIYVTFRCKVSTLSIVDSFIEVSHIRSACGLWFLSFPCGNTVIIVFSLVVFVGFSFI